MKIFVFFLFVFCVCKATLLDISKKNFFCIYKNMTEGSLRISVEFVGENEKTSTVQVIFRNFYRAQIKITQKNDFLCKNS